LARQRVIVRERHMDERRAGGVCGPWRIDNEIGA
jgi:hypothetical protein